MFIRDIHKARGSEVHGIEPDLTVDDAVHQLVCHNIGSLIVFDRSSGRRRMIGIITERDILRAQDAHRAPLEQLRVREVMTTSVITTTVDTPLTEAMRIMTDRRVRHLPVLDDDGEVAGMISIGDIVKAHHDELATENHCMRSYIQGEGADVGVR